LPKGPGKKLSGEEVARQLRRARQYFANSGFAVGSPSHISDDFSQLLLISHEEQTEALRKVLDEISPDHYNGPHPPDHISREPKCKGERMLQFTWPSACFGGKRMYVKFCLKDNRLYLVRIHKDFKRPS
jgi:hypothetical protein